MSIRVVHVLPHRGGGGETYVDYLERMPGYAHERFYLSAGRTPLAAAVSIPGRWGRLAARIRAADLVHCHGEQSTTIVLPLLRARPAVMTTHGLHLFRRTQGLAHAAVGRAIVRIARACDILICTSAAEREELCSVLEGETRAKLRVIYNGIDPPPTPNTDERSATRAELGVATDAVLGLFIGQLEPRKAPRLAVRAANEASASGVPLVLTVVGDGPQASELEALAGDGVRLLGHRSDVHPLLAAADVFVQPSEREGLSYALLEAMGHGLAIVASDGHGNPEAVGDAGLEFPVGDREALVAALVRLSSDPALRSRLGARAAVRVRDHFTADRFIAETEAVYRQALGRVTEPAQAGAGSSA